MIDRALDFPVEVLLWVAPVALLILITIIVEKYYEK
jgi:cytochrome c-type biogenesis protein CcmH/NrfF